MKEKETGTHQTYLKLVHLSSHETAFARMRENEPDMVLRV
jgi:hypothetical protein